LLNRCRVQTDMASTIGAFC